MNLRKTQILAMEDKERRLELIKALKFRDRMFCNLGSITKPYYIKQIPENLPDADVEELESYESKMGVNPDSYLSFTFFPHENGRGHHELRIIYHESGLQKVLDEIRGGQ